MRLRLTLFAIIIISITASACGKGSLSDLGNIELVAKSDECLRKQPTSPGRVTACENIKKECEKRRKKGNYAC